jgi:hypothetical protein
MLIHRVEPMVHRIEAVVHGVDPLVGPNEPFGNQLDLSASLFVKNREPVQSSVDPVESFLRHGGHSRMGTTTLPSSATMRRRNEDAVEISPVFAGSVLANRRNCHDVERRARTNLHPSTGQDERSW